MTHLPMPGPARNPSSTDPGRRTRRVAAVCGRFCQGSDLVILSLAFMFVIILPFFSGVGQSLAGFLSLRISMRNVILAAFCIATWRMILLSVGVYSPARTRTTVDYLFRCVIALNSCTAVVGLIEVVLRKQQNVWHTVEIFWIASFALMASVRLLIVLYSYTLRPMLRRKRALVIIGSGPRAQKVFEELSAHTEWSYSLVGFVDSEPQGGYVSPDLILGGISDLERILMRNVVDEVVIALPMKSQYEVVGHSIAVCQMLGIQCQYFTDYFGTALTKRRSSAGADSGRMLLEVVTDDYRLKLKRVFDVVVSLLLLVVLSPVYLATAIAVKLTSPGPIFFLQRRFGLNKRTFFMYKFRSMCIDAEAKQADIEHLNELKGPTFKIKNDPRITPIGAFIRKLSIDELPQLFNVISGEMSLVGPRPLPLRDVERFSESWLMRRFSVKPGVTCMWQIMGRSDTDFERCIDLDLQYIDNWSLSLDIIILIKTIPAVLFSRGAV